MWAQVRESLWVGWEERATDTGVVGRVQTFLVIVLGMACEKDVLLCQGDIRPSIGGKRGLRQQFLTSVSVPKFTLK